MKTQRLRLRRLRTEDAPAVYRLTSNPEVAAYMRFATQASLEEARELIEEYTGKGNEAFLYTEEATRTPVGVFALKKDFEEDGAYDLSVFSDPIFWNHGYTTELLQFFLPYAKEKLRAKVLKAYVVSQNLGSRRALEKNGFTIREHLVFDDLPGGFTSISSLYRIIGNPTAGRACAVFRCGVCTYCGQRGGTGCPFSVPVEAVAISLEWFHTVLP